MTLDPRNCQDLWRMIVKLRSGNPGTSGPGGPGDDLELLEHLDAWSEAIIAAGSSPQRIAGVYNVGGGPTSAPG